MGWIHMCPANRTDDGRGERIYRRSEVSLGLQWTRRWTRRPRVCHVGIPLPDQGRFAERLGGICRSVWNTGLEQRRAYRRRGAFIGYAEQCRQLAEAKRPRTVPGWPRLPRRSSSRR
ncbi:helix-turn-helix domain-containing protein [Nonomuraea sp. NPDC003201]